MQSPRHLPARCLRCRAAAAGGRQGASAPGLDPSAGAVGRLTRGKRGLDERPWSATQQQYCSPRRRWTAAERQAAALEAAALRRSRPLGRSAGAVAAPSRKEDFGLHGRGQRLRGAVLQKRRGRRLVQTRSLRRSRNLMFMFISMDP